jgi:phospholipase/carboxylesterase
MTGSIVFQRPAEGVPAQQLMLLFHGFGATPLDLAPLAAHLGVHFPQALVIGVAAPESSAPIAPGGRQWFTAAELTEETRPALVAAAMPAFEDVVRHWQRESGLGVAATALVGFSQGAIMALEATQRAAAPALAGRVVAIAGRFAVPPAHPAPETTFHLFHGKHDPVIPYRFAIEGAERLIALGADVTADVLPFVKHEIEAEILALIVERLQGHVPKRLWDEALRAGARLAPASTDERGGPVRY